MPDKNDDDMTLDELIEGEANSCDCCEFPNPVGGLEKFPIQRDSITATEEKTLCRLCANTLIGVHFEFPQETNYHSLLVRRQMNYLANQLRRDIADLKENKS